MKRYAVVGGGITGLAAAFELRLVEPDAEVTVYEPGRLGGKVRTTPFAGRLVDEGADAFLARVPWGRELCDELGLGGELVSPATGAAYLAEGNELQRIPEGLVLGIPTDAAAEVWEEASGAPPLAPGEDISVGALVRARLGRNVLERLVDPLIGGINAGDSDRLSVRAATPQFAAAAESGSLVVGLRSMPRADGPVFWALPGGMEALVVALTPERVVAEAVDDVRGLGADGVVVATPAPAMAALVGGDAADALRSIGHSSPVLVAFAFARDAVRHPLDASGFLVPRVEGRFMTACSFATTKWAHLGATDPSTVVLRASAGRYGDDRAVDASGDDVIAWMLEDLEDLVGLDADPYEVRITRWPNGFPQYEPGHLDRVAAVEDDVRARFDGRVAVAGAALHGIGIPACIRSGREAARRIASP